MGFSLNHRFSLPFPFYLLVAAICHLGVLSVRSAEAIESWAEYPRPAGAGALTSVAFGNGIFVAVGANGTIVTSSNGMDWTKVNAGVTGASGRVRFVNDRFFAWGFGAVLMSTNGSNWTAVGADFSDVSYANGTFYSVLWDQLGQSTNLVDWTHTTLTSPIGGFRHIAYGNGAFAANGGNGPTYQYAYSGDGQQWFQAGATSMSHLSEITHQNGAFSSINLVSYMEPREFPGPPGFPPQYMYFPVEAYVVSFSGNAAGWGAAFRLHGNISAIANKVAAGGQYWVVPAGNAIFYTTNVVTSDPHTATNWTRVNVTVENSENGSADIAFGNNVFVAVMHGKIVKSNPVSGSAPVRIIRHPESFAATMGGTATFSVAAQGSDPMTFQWRHAGTNLAGATAFELTLTNLTVDAAGEYDVVVTNPSGSVTSDAAELTVHFADVKLYAGVTLRGEIGDKFKLEYRDQLQNPDVWNVVTNVTLTTSESIWIDYSTPEGTNRFYRATYLGK
jgi:hypothetical protein